MSNYIPDFKKGAVNPYNFVELGTGVERKSPERGTLTGVIHCSLYNKTPLAIPDLSYGKSQNKNSEHKNADFFKVDGRPVIPGSEIRGVIRSAYEVLSNSCLSVNNNNILSARSSDVRTAGIICFKKSDMKWHLYKADAKQLKYDNSDDFDETSDVIREWYRFDKKHKITHKFIKTSKEIFAENLEDAVEDYNNVCSIYAANNKELTRFIKAPSRDGRGFPVYYKESENDGKTYVYLSPAQISRSVFRNRVDDLLGSYRHCDDTSYVCEACGLFGMIGKRESEKSDIASRIRFTDAVPKNKPRLFRATLKELSGPKISSVEFYSTAPDMKTLWTYDTEGVKLNGRKFYFHHEGDYSTSEMTKRNLTAELVDKGAAFRFDIFFEDLTERELSRLIWTLAIGENSADGKQMHKLGHGKPLGLGSVKITVDSVVQREFDTALLTYSEKNIDTKAFFEKVPFDESADYYKDFMCITDFTYLKGTKVAYPYGYENKGSKTSAGTLTWFKANHNDGKMVASKGKCTVGYPLPKIRDEEKRLPALIKSSGNGNRGKWR